MLLMCPHCKNLCASNGEKAGEPMECTECHHSFTVPLPQASPIVVSTPRQRAARRRRSGTGLRKLGFAMSTIGMVGFTVNYGMAGNSHEYAMASLLSGMGVLLGLLIYGFGRMMDSLD